jgi:hypothetical protein
VYLHKQTVKSSLLVWILFFKKNIKNMKEKKKKKHNVEQNIVVKEKKQNTKIDISLIISGLALLITALQFIVTTPFFTDFYYQTSFEVEENLPLLHDNDLTSIFLVKNTSQNTVNNIELGIQILANDKVQITPNRNIQINFKENGPKLKDCFFTIDKLVPGENIFVVISSNYDSIKKYNTDFLDNSKPLTNDLTKDKPFKTGNKSKYLSFPNIFVAKFDKGFGKITRLPKEIILNHKQTKKDITKE